MILKLCNRAEFEMFDTREAAYKRRNYYIQGVAEYLEFVLVGQYRMDTETAPIRIEAVREGKSTPSDKS